MTKEELVKLIEEKQEKGFLSKEDYYEIGLAHRELPKQERNWSWLLSLTGGFKSSESYRTFVVHRLRDSNTLDVAHDKEFVAQKQELFKATQRLRDERTSINRTLREEARLERFIQTIQDVAKEYRKLPAVICAKVDMNRPTSEAVYGLADLHLGPIIENYINTYDYNEAVERINKVAEDIIYYCKLNNVSKLHFINLGDLIAGIIHPTIRLEQEYDVIEQVLKASELVTELLNVLQQAAPEVTYRSVVDNHARVMPDKNQHIELENLNRIIDVFVEERLKDTNIKFMKDNVDIGIGRIELRSGKKLYFMHGHQDRKSSVVQDIVGLTHEFPDYILMGHYHNSAEHTFQGAKLFITSSIIGTDTYAFGKRLFGQPEQKLLIFDARNNVVDVDIRCKVK